MPVQRKCASPFRDQTRCPSRVRPQVSSIRPQQAGSWSAFPPAAPALHSRCYACLERPPSAPAFPITYLSARIHTDALHSISRRQPGSTRQTETDIAGGKAAWGDVLGDQGQQPPPARLHRAVARQPERHGVGADPGQPRLFSALRVPHIRWLVRATLRSLQWCLDTT